MPNNNPCTCPVVWAFAPAASTITPGCPVHGGERPDDDPAPVPTCNGRDCGGRPHE